jgi:hypothetical protein
MWLLQMSGIILGAHIVILFAVVGTILVADYIAMQWFRGTIPTIGSTTVKRLHDAMWVGLGLMILTGALLFWPSRTFLLARPAFWIKMGFVLALVVNGLFIGKLMHIATVRNFASLTRNEKLLMMASGAVSLTAWVGSTISAFFLIPE